MFRKSATYTRKKAITSFLKKSEVYYGTYSPSSSAKKAAELGITMSDFQKRRPNITYEGHSKHFQMPGFTGHVPEECQVHAVHQTTHNILRLWNKSFWKGTQVIEAPTHLSILVCNYLHRTHFPPINHTLFSPEEAIYLYCIVYCTSRIHSDLFYTLIMIILLRSENISSLRN